MSAETTSLKGTATPQPCPTCGSVRVVGITYGFPIGETWGSAQAGRISIGGCVSPAQDRWEDEWHCWACADREWLAKHERHEHRNGRTRHDCADDGALDGPVADAVDVASGRRDVADRFRPAGFIDRLWPYLRDVPDGAPAWRPNVERIREALDADKTLAADDAGPGLDEERLGPLSGAIASLLAEVPTDMALHTLDDAAYERAVGMSSPAHQAVELLERGTGMLRADAVRIVADRRPALLAPRDGTVDRALGLPADRQVWRPWWRTLTADPELVDRLEQVRDELARPDVPLLRIAWLSVLTRERDAERAGGPSPAADLPEARWFLCPERTHGATPEQLLEVGIVEPLVAGRPRCVVRASVAHDAHGPILVVIDRRAQAALDDAPDGSRDERLRLVAPPTADPRGTGVLAQVKCADGTLEEVLVRRAVPADALWLSSLGLAGEPSLEILDELVRRHAERRPTKEQILLLSLPRMAPHGVAYRIGSGTDQRTWVRVDRRWIEQRTAARQRLPERAMETLLELRGLPWSRAVVRRMPDLLGNACPTQQVQPWGVPHAIVMIDRERRDHDELLGLLLCSEEAASVDARTLGPSLAAVVSGIGGCVESYIEYVQAESEDEGGPGPDWPDPDLEALAALRDPDFSLRVDDLVSLLDEFERQFGDPEPSEWGH